MNPLFLIAVLCWSCCAGAGAAQDGRRGRDQADRNRPSQNSAGLDVPAQTLNVVLGRPTRDSVTLSVLTFQNLEGSIAYGTERGQFPLSTPARRFKPGDPAEITLGALRPDTQYFYQVRLDGTNSLDGNFRTQRPAGAPFTFTLTADSHLDDRVDAAAYQRTLATALADAPDFHVDLGDTFMTEKHDNRENARRQYLAQRFYFGQLSRSAPLFLVLGNHDGESPRGQGSEADSLAVWSCGMRKRYFPNPEPDRFFSGNPAKHPQAGLLQNYYAWEWGDALIVVLDPFWYTHQERGRADNWSRTLGSEQYHWLRRTLEASRAKFKFVCIHHLVGGLDSQCRGGAEAAPLYEWGGKNPDGTDGFQQNRPGWPLPIHSLLVQHGVSVVFHGHDHLYARQELDGVIYQEVPQPGNPSSGPVPRNAAAYGYRQGTILGGSGYLRVRISPADARVEYVETSSPPSGGAARVADQYAVSPRQK